MSIGTNIEIGKAWVGNVQVGEAYAGDRLIYKAEQAYNDVQVATKSYVGDGLTGTQTADVSYDMRGFNALTLAYDCTVEMVWSKGNGLGSTLSIYAVFNGTERLITTTAHTLYGAGTTYTLNGNATIDLTAYTEEQKQNVDFKATLAVNEASGEDKAKYFTVNLSNILAQ